MYFEQIMTVAGASNICACIPCTSGKCMINHWAMNPKRHTRFVTGNYNYETGSMTGILGQLKWESIKKRRKDKIDIYCYIKVLKVKPVYQRMTLSPKTRCCRNQHSMAFQTPIANTDVYKGSFFPPPTIRDWNALPDSLISSAEDAEDCVAKFTSLVRARD